MTSVQPDHGTQVLVAGHLCLDIIPGLEQAARLVPGTLVEAGPIVLRLGGCVANTARSLRSLGVATRISATVGDDQLGRVTRSLMADEAPGEAGLRVVRGATTSYSIVIESLGVDRMFWHHPGANAAFDGRDTDVDDAKVVHVGYPSLLPALTVDDGAALVDLFERCQRAGIVTSLDLAVTVPDPERWRRFFNAVLPHVDVISPSADDLRSVDLPSGVKTSAREFAEHLVAGGVAVALVTDGANGMHLRTGDSSRLARAGAALAGLSGWDGAAIDLPARPLRSIASTNGAGDAATAGLLAAIVRESSLAEALAAAADSAALSIAGGMQR